MTTERDIHTALCDLVQKIADQTGLRVDGAAFEWIDSSTHVATSSRVVSARVSLSGPVKEGT